MVWGNSYAQALVGQVLIRGFWNSVIYKGLLHGIFLDIDPLLLKGFRCSSSGHVWDLWFLGERRGFGSGCS